MESTGSICSSPTATTAPSSSRTSSVDTDHDHLGKVLTYCAGTGAQVVIWISEHLNEEHRAALNWLNQNTVSGVAFFGVEVALATIDGSKPAPFFRVVARPDEWTKSKQPSGSPADWSWTAYQAALNISADRIAVGQAVVEQLEALIADEGLPGSRCFGKASSRSSVLATTTSSTSISGGTPRHESR